MFFLLFGFWVLLNGHWTLEIAIVGVVVCAALYAFMAAFMGYSPRKEWAVVKRLGRILAYAGYLVCEVVKSSVAVLKLIWSPKLVPEPKLISFRTKLRTDAGKVVLADSITLTPGTITVNVKGDRMLVHCLDASFEIDEDDFEMEERVMRVEGGHDHA
ncbi:MAG: Na+/H+ antiporter subunit E [Christensenellaceae bacterium]|nr:Na+/H+ antiporter subunit E [Christensenellaceae bacterium]